MLVCKQFLAYRELLKWVEERSGDLRWFWNKFQLIKFQLEVAYIILHWLDTEYLPPAANLHPATVTATSDRSQANIYINYHSIYHSTGVATVQKPRSLGMNRLEKKKVNLGKSYIIIDTLLLAPPCSNVSWLQCITRCNGFQPDLQFDWAHLCIENYATKRSGLKFEWTLRRIAASPFSSKINLTSIRNHLKENRQCLMTQMLESNNIAFFYWIIFNKK